MESPHNYGSPRPDDDHEVIASAFAALPDPAIPETLLPALIAGIPGASGLAIGSAASAVPAVPMRASLLRTTCLWTAGGLAAAACIAFAAVLLPLVLRQPDAANGLLRAGPASHPPADYSVLTTDMATIILKDTDPCRILPSHVN